MKQRTSQILFQYWNDVRGRRLAPQRFDVEPARIAAILPETCILEQDAAGQCVFRLAGTRICDNFGRELRGATLNDLATPTDREAIQNIITTVTEQGGVGVLELSARDPEGRMVEFEVLLLPLVHLDGQITRYLGAISPIDPPAWLGTAPLTPMGVTADAVVWPDGRPHAVVEKANRQSPFLPAMVGARVVRVDRRQFRVLDGGLADAATEKGLKS